MNFSPRPKEEPEINLIPFIDVLLVVLIFLMLTTTFSKLTEMKIQLPTADSALKRDYPKEIVVTVSKDGGYMVNKTAVDGRNAESLGAALQAAATGGANSVVVINADANATHQSVITVMQAAQRTGLSHVTFATQNTARVTP